MTGSGVRNVGAKTRLAARVSPGTIDAILVLIALEFLLMGGVLVRIDGGTLLEPWSYYLVSGAALMVALRAALAGSDLRWISLMLLVSLIAHVALLGWLLQAQTTHARLV